MQPSSLSDEAIKLWHCYFRGRKNTLRFGGDHAQMEITPLARKALTELLEVGAVEPIEPDDQWPGREHYGATEMDLTALSLERGGGTHEKAFRWLTEGDFVTFKKKPGAEEKQPRATIYFGSQ
jgi:hypothetical protein